MNAPFWAILLVFLAGIDENNSCEIDWTYYSIDKKQKLEEVFRDSWINILRFNRLDRKHLWPGRKIKIPRNLTDIERYTPLPSCYKPAESYGKYVLVSLENQFLGCYESGRLVFSFPISSGKQPHETPVGSFKVLERHRDHLSSKYKIKELDVPYPMHWGVKFHTSREGEGFWIHGRDLPGYPDSHGCIGLYDEEMQKQYYGHPKNPRLDDAKRFYLWLFPGTENDKRYIIISNGPPVEIVKKIK